MLLIILGILLIAISIAVGHSMYMSGTTEQNKEAICSKLITIAENAYQYKIASSVLGGGGNTYTNYRLSHTLAHDDNGDYALSALSPISASFTGSSALNNGWIATCTVDDSGKT